MILSICQTLFICCIYQVFIRLALTVSSSENEEIDLELKLAPPGKLYQSKPSSDRKEANFIPLHNASPKLSPSQHPSTQRSQVNPTAQTNVKTKKRTWQSKPEEEMTEKELAKKERQREANRRYEERRKNDPNRYKNYLARKKIFNREYHQRVNQDPQKLSRRRERHKRNFKAFLERERKKANTNDQSPPQQGR